MKDSIHVVQMDLHLKQFNFEWSLNICKIKVCLNKILDQKLRMSVKTYEDEKILSAILRKNAFEILVF